MKNIYNLIVDIRDSNIALPNIIPGEITSGILNPDGLFNLLVYKSINYKDLLNKNNFDIPRIQGNLFYKF